MSDSLAEQELLYLIYKYIESRTPCDETKLKLADELENNILLGSIYKWDGHKQTAKIADMERKYEGIESSHLLSLVKKSTGVSDFGPNTSILQPAIIVTTKPNLEDMKLIQSRLIDITIDQSSIRFQFAKANHTLRKMIESINAAAKAEMNMQTDHLAGLISSESCSGDLPQNPLPPSNGSVASQTAQAFRVRGRDRMECRVQELSEELEALAVEKSSLEQSFYANRPKNLTLGIEHGVMGCGLDWLMGRRMGPSQYALRSESALNLHTKSSSPETNSDSSDGHLPFAHSVENLLLVRYNLLWHSSGHILNHAYCSVMDRSGRYVFSGADDYLVKLWDIDTGQLIQTYRGHSAPITVVAVSYDNSLMASACTIGSVRLWRIADGKCISVMKHEGMTNWLQFDPITGALVSAGDDGMCVVWDLTSFLPLQRRDISIDMDDRMLSNADSERYTPGMNSGDHELIIWNSDVFLSLDDGYVFGGGVLYSDQFPLLDCILDTLRTSPGRGAFSNAKDGKHILLGLADKALLSSTSTNHLTAMSGVAATSAAIVFGEESGSMNLPSVGEASVTSASYNTRIGMSLSSSLDRPIGAMRSLFSWNCQTSVGGLVVSSQPSSSSESSTTRPKLLKSLSLPHINGLSGTPIRVTTIDICNGDNLLVTGCEDGIARLWRFNDNPPLHTPEQGPNGPGGYEYVVGTRDLKRAEDLAALKKLAAVLSPVDYAKMQTVAKHLVCRLEGHMDGVTDVKFSHSGDRICTGSLKDGTVRIWSFSKGFTKTEHIILNMNDDDGRGDTDFASPLEAYGSSAGRMGRTNRRNPNVKPMVYNVCWTCDDQYIVVVHSYNPSHPDNATREKKNAVSTKLRVYDSMSGKLLNSFHISAARSHVLTLHPTLPFVAATGGEDGFMRIWNIQRGCVIDQYMLPCPAGVPDQVEGSPIEILDGSFDPDGTRIAFTDQLGRVIVLGRDDPTRYAGKVLAEQYYSTDYAEIFEDENGWPIDAGSQLPLNDAPVGPLVRMDGSPYDLNSYSAKPLPKPLPKNAVLDVWKEYCVWQTGHARVMHKTFLAMKRMKHRVNTCDGASRNRQMSRQLNVWGTEASTLARQQVEAHAKKGKTGTGIASNGSRGGNIHTLSSIAGRSSDRDYQSRWSGTASYFNDPDIEAGELVDMITDSEDSEYAGAPGRSRRRGKPSTRSSSGLSTSQGRRLGGRRIRRESRAEGNSRAQRRVRRRVNRILNDGSEDEDLEEESALGSEDSNDGHSGDSSSGDDEDEQRVHYEDLDDSDSDGPSRNRGRPKRSKPHADGYSVKRKSKKLVRSANGTTASRRQSGRTKERDVVEDDDEHDRKVTTRHHTVPLHVDVDREWMMLEKTSDFEYAPQVGDHVVYFPQGHLEHLNLFPESRRPPWMMFPQRWPVVECKILSLELELPTTAELKKSTSVIAKISLLLIGRPTKWGGSSPGAMYTNFTPPRESRHAQNSEIIFNVNLRSSAAPDCIVPWHVYMKACAVQWTPGLNFVSYFKEMNTTTGDMTMVRYPGTVVKVSDRDRQDWPQSGWECLQITWNNDLEDAEVSRISPWDAVAVSSMTTTLDTQCTCLPDPLNDALLVHIDKLMEDERMEAFAYPVDSEVFADYYCVIPVPMYLDLIKHRLKNKYYRQLDALEFDISQILHNCEIYNVEGSPIIGDAARLVEDLKATIEPFRNEALGYQSTDSIIIQGDEAKETLSDELVIRLPVGARGTPSSQREDLENGEHAESNVDRDEGLVIRTRRSSRRGESTSNSSVNAGPSTRSRGDLMLRFNTSSLRVPTASPTARQEQGTDSNHQTTIGVDEVEGVSSIGAADVLGGGRKRRRPQYLDDHISSLDHGGKTTVSSNKTTGSMAAASGSTSNGNGSSAAATGVGWSNGRDGSESTSDGNRRPTRRRRTDNSEEGEENEVDKYEEEEGSIREVGGGRVGSSVRSSRKGVGVFVTVRSGSERPTRRGSNVKYTEESASEGGSDGDDLEEALPNEVKGRSSRRITSKISQSLYEQMGVVIESAMANDNDEVFSYPVDVASVPGYLDIVQNPMDFSKIRERYQSGTYYRTMKQLVDDLYLVFDNCELYNADGSDIFKESKRQRRDLKKVLQFYVI